MGPLRGPGCCLGSTSHPPQQTSLTLVHPLEGRGWAWPAETPRSGVAKPALCLVCVRLLRVSCQHFLGCWRWTTQPTTRGSGNPHLFGAPLRKAVHESCPPTSRAHLGVRAEPFLRSQGCLGWRILNRLDLTLGHPVSERGTVRLAESSVWSVGGL